VAEITTMTLNPAFARSFRLSPSSAALHRRLLEPACAGQARRVLPALRRLRQSLTVADPAELVVGARAQWALGHGDAACELLDAALAAGAPEALALASLCRPDGDVFIARRLVEGAPAERALARCDGAVRALDRGAVTVARAFIAEALACEPEHGEAARFARFLDEAGEGAAEIWRGEAEATDSLARDVRDLRPWPHFGWMSQERWRRVAVAPEVLAPEGSAAAALVAAAVPGRRFAMAEEYSGLPADHPLVRCELLLDRADSLAREARPVGPIAMELWEAARLTDVITLCDAAQALVTLGVRSASAAPVALIAASVLRELDPGRDLWSAYHARLLFAVGRTHKARLEAQVLALNGFSDPVSAALCAATAMLCGDAATARGLFAQYAHHPTLGLALEPLYQKRVRPESIHTLLADRAMPRLSQLGGGGCPAEVQ
jgi:hypothetical protein